MVEVTLRSVSNAVLKSVSTTFPPGKLSVVVGPNGAGKTTLIKVVAGLIRYSGNVYYDGVCVDDVPPYERKISYVPQNNALFPNLKVWDNVAYGLRARGYKEEHIKQRVSEVLQALRLEGLSCRYPATLSGGESKKVALARALAVDPELLLLDEPFVGLDVESRGVLEQEIMMAIKRFGRTVILVTHSIEKALANAEKIHIMWEGQLVFSGTSEELSRAQLPEDIRFWLGSFVEADVVHEEKGLTYIELGEYRIPLLYTPESGGVRKAFIPSGAVRICRKGQLKGRVVSVRKSRTYYRAVVDVDGGQLHVITPLRLRVGEEVSLRIYKAIPVGGS